MMEIAVIGDRHTAYGFRLAGVSKSFSVDRIVREDMRNTLKALCEDNIGIIVVTDKVAEGIRDILEEVTRFKKGIAPIVLEIPGGGAVIGKTDPMQALIKRTVGFEIA